jgi:hypothetical protein
MYPGRAGYLRVNAVPRLSIRLPVYSGEYYVAEAIDVTRHAERARMRRPASGGAGMTGGACGVVVAGDRVGTTE